MNLWRRYELEAGADLFGAWVVVTWFGRIGAVGRCLRRQVASEDEARRLIDQSLRRRGTAPTRIGVAYEIRSICDPAGWLERQEAAGS